MMNKTKPLERQASGRLLFYTSPVNPPKSGCHGNHPACSEREVEAGAESEKTDPACGGSSVATTPSEVAWITVRDALFGLPEPTSSAAKSLLDYKLEARMISKCLSEIA
jgi:hypothetical protein